MIIYLLLLEDKEAIKKVTKTLTVYCALVLVFFQSGSLVIMAMQYIPLAPVEKNIISLYSAIFINLLICSNYFVYFAMRYIILSNKKQNKKIFSVEFRAEFKRQLWTIAGVLERMPLIGCLIPTPPTTIMKATTTRVTTIL